MKSNSNEQRYRNTLQRVDHIVRRRRNTKQKRVGPDSQKSQKGLRSRKARRKERFSRRSNVVVQKSRSKQSNTHVPFPIINSSHVKNGTLAYANRKTRNVISSAFENSESGIIKNYENEFSMPHIKPPQVGAGVDVFGSYVCMQGTEALGPIYVHPTSTANIASGRFTDVGDVLYHIPIGKDFLSNTRMRLLMENYEKWKPIHIVVEFQPLGDATLSGGVVAVPVCDPAINLALGADSNFTVSRAMDFEESINFNVYNQARVKFPPLSEDVEPDYITGGHDSRLEIPYTLWVIAQTSFPPSVDEDTRSVFWVSIHYEIRLYEPALPDLSVTNSSASVTMSTTYANYFTTFTVGHLVKGVDGVFGIGVGDLDKIGIIQVTSDWIDGASAVFCWTSETHEQTNISKGTLIYYKRCYDESTSTYYTGFFSTIEGAYNDSNPFYWCVGANSTSIAGHLDYTTYDLDHTL